MNDPMFWPTIMWGLGSLALFYGYALMIERHQIERRNRQRRAQMRRQLYGS